MKHLALIFFLIMPLGACGTTSSSGDRLPEGAQYYFSLFGDSRDGNSVFADLQSRSILAGRPLFAVHLGDMISNPQSAEQWPLFVSLTQTYFPRDSFFPVIGNHDVGDARSHQLFRTVYPDIPETGYYAKQLRECFCVFLNTESLEVVPGVIGPLQLAWLESQLSSEAARHAKYRMVFTHRPPYPQYRYRPYPLEPTESLHQIFKTYGVQAVVSGHEHSYSRTEKDGVIYLISGGAGSPLDVTAAPGAAYYHYVQVAYLGTALQFRSIDFLGNIQDDFKIALP